MEQWVVDILEEEKRKRNIPLEVKILNGNYYLYRSTSRYYRTRHGPRKVSEYIGRITEKGVMESHHVERTVYEYGNSQLVYSLSGEIIQALRKHFPDTWESIYALSVVRLLDPMPLKSVKERWEKIHLSTILHPHLSPNSLSDLLRDTGSDMSGQYDLFQMLMQGSTDWLSTSPRYSPGRRTSTWHRRGTMLIMNTYRRSTWPWSLILTVTDPYS